MELQKQNNKIKVFQIEEMLLAHTTNINAMITQLSIESKILLNIINNQCT